MKRKIIRATAIAFMGLTLAGISFTAVEPTGKSLTAGITKATMVDLGEVSQIQVTQTDVAVTGTQNGTETNTQVQTTDSHYGYKNLGISVAEGNLNVRTEPSVSSAVAGKLPENGGCEVLEYAGEWIRISSGEVNGYVLGSYLLTGEQAVARAAEKAAEVAVVRTQTLNVRMEPNTECGILALMPEGETLEVSAHLDGWLQVSVDGETGYISSDYVETSVQLPKAVTLEEIRFGQGVSGTRSSLASYAVQFVGNPYVWGGTSLTKGADCSGFTMSVYRHYGISLPHSSKAQANCGTRIKASEAKPGDLFFYGSGRSISHVAIYIGNGKVVHASSPKSGIKISSSNYRKPICVVSLLD